MICWRWGRLPTSVFLGFPCGSAGKESACNAGDLGSILGLRQSPGEGKGYPLQDSGLENFIDYIVHGVAKSQTWLSDFHFNHKWVLKFVKGFFCIYWDHHVVFIFQFVDMVFHIDWFAYIEESLHSWNKPNLIMMYELFDVILNSAKILLRIFASLFISDIG